VSPLKDKYSKTYMSLKGNIYFDNYRLLAQTKRCAIGKTIQIGCKKKTSERKSNACLNQLILVFRCALNACPTTRLQPALEWRQGERKKSLESADCIQVAEG
jgi:hypothetical protein